MPELSRSYNLTVTTLGPLHIGSGRELLRDYDYAVYQGQTWRINEDALLDAALGGGQFDAALLRRPAAELLQPTDFVPGSPLFRYVVKGTPRSPEKGARLHEQLKNVFDRPYLPGSSLKGAFRTALLDWALAQQPQALDTGRLKDSRSWAAQPLERALLGRDPNHDLLRALRVADSEPLDPNESLYIVNAQVMTGGQPASPIEVEAVRHNTRFRAAVTLDLFLFSDQAQGVVGPAERLQWLEGLMAVCRARAVPLLAAERDWFTRHYPDSPLGNFYAHYHDEVARWTGPRCLLQVGWGGGWQSKTVGRHLNDRQREEVIQRYRLARGQRQPGDPFPKSRRVVLDSQGRLAAPLGWVRVEMTPEEKP